MILLISGPARSGKDTVADIICEKYPEYNFQRFAFANALKKELESLVQEKYGCSVWDDTKKHLFRQELIDYGCQKRKETNGEHWVNKFFEIYEEGDNKEKNWLITDFRFGGANGEKQKIIIKFLFDYNYIFEEKDHPVQSLHIIRIQNNEPILPTIPEEINNEDSLRKDANKLLLLEWKENLDKQYIAEKIKKLELL